MSNIYGGYDSDEHQDHIQKANGTTSASDSLSTKADATRKDNRLPVDTVALNDRTNKALAETGKPENMKGTTEAFNSWMEDMHKFGSKYDSMQAARKGQIPASPAPDARSKIPLKGIK